MRVYISISFFPNDKKCTGSVQFGEKCTGLVFFSDLLECFSKKKKRNLKSKNAFLLQMERKKFVVICSKKPEIARKIGHLKVSQKSLQQQNKKITYLLFFFLTASSFQKKRKGTCHKTRGNARQRTSAREERPVKLAFTDVVYYRVDK